jgi:hypothetical protein
MLGVFNFSSHGSVMKVLHMKLKFVIIFLMVKDKTDARCKINADIPVLIQLQGMQFQT